MDSHALRKMEILKMPKEALLDLVNRELRNSSIHENENSQSEGIEVGLGDSDSDSESNDDDCKQ